MRKVQLEIKKQEKEVSTILNTAQVHVFGMFLIYFIFVPQGTVLGPILFSLTKSSTRDKCRKLALAKTL